MIIKDWTRKACVEIGEGFRGGNRLTDDQIQDIIEKHCPFEKDVTYEPVTETSRKLDEIQKVQKEHETILRFIRSAVR